MIHYVSDLLVTPSELDWFFNMNSDNTNDHHVSLAAVIQLHIMFLPLVADFLCWHAVAANPNPYYM